MKAVELHRMMREYITGVPVADLATKYGLSPQRIYNLASEYEVSRIRRWTPEETAMLRNLYPTHNRNEIARILNRTPKSVMRRVEYLGLRKNQRYFDKVPPDKQDLYRWLTKHKNLTASEAFNIVTKEKS